MTTRITDPNIVLRNNVLTKDFCNNLIAKFEANIQKAGKGVTSAGLNERAKRSLDLSMYQFDWIFKEEIPFLNNTLNGLLDDYVLGRKEWNCFERIDETFADPIENGVFSPFSSQTGQHVFSIDINIQKTLPNDGYDWHNDASCETRNGLRVLTYIIYLNDVKEGWTQFINGDQVQPTAGSVLFFPATWTYVHRGYPPKSVKYIATNWICQSMERLHLPRQKEFLPEHTELLEKIKNSV